MSRSWWPGWLDTRPEALVEQNGHADLDDVPSGATPRVFRDLESVALQRDVWRRKARLLGRQYGRASRTISEQRGTIASLRAQLAAALSNETPGAPAHSGAAGKPGQVDGDDHTAGVPSGATRGAPDGTDLQCQRIADGLKVGDRAPDWWMDYTGMACQAISKNSYLCTRRGGHRGQHVATAGRRVCDVWPPQPENPQRDVIARVLVDHELLADDTCRCRWGDFQSRCTDDPVDCGSPLWHAEHVAAQLVAADASAGGARTALDRLTAALHQRLADDKRFVRIGEIFELIQGAK